MLLEIEKWAKGKNPFISGHAIKIAFMAEEAFLLSADTRERKLVSGIFNTPDLQTWLSLYKRSNKILKTVMRPSREAGGFHRLDAWVYDGVSIGLKGIRRDKDGVIAEIKKMSPDELNSLKRSVNRFVNRWHKGLIRDIKNEINNVPDPAYDEAVHLQGKSPEVLFFLKVIIPCWFIYAQHPSTLLRLARKGNMDALDKLLRLDPSVVFDPKIAKRFHLAAHSTKRSDYSSFAEALMREPKADKLRKKAKIRIAGVIAYFSGSLGQRLNEPQIRKLFDAVSKDLDRGDIDTDLPLAPETFSKDIQRQVHALRQILEPDKI